MNEPCSPAVQAALSTYGEVTRDEAPVSHLVWQRAMARAQTPPRWQQGLVFAMACSVGVLITTTVMGLRTTPTPTPKPPVASTPAVFPGPGALVRRDDDHWLLTRGTVRVVAGAERQIIRTAQVEITIRNAQVLVEAVEGSTHAYVEVGSVVWRDPTGEHVASVHSRIEVPTRRPLPDSEVSDSLAVETALYEEGLRRHAAGRLGDAMESFREYRRRFPAGVFAPEASVALMLEAKELGLVQEARAEANLFLEHFPTDPRAGEVTSWREQLR